MPNSLPIIIFAGPFRRQKPKASKKEVSTWIRRKWLKTTGGKQVLSQSEWVTKTHALEGCGKLKRRGHSKQPTCFYRLIRKTKAKSSRQMTLEFVLHAKYNGQASSTSSQLTQCLKHKVGYNRNKPKWIIWSIIIHTKNSILKKKETKNTKMAQSW